jgi:hypothetical protein
MYKTANGWTKNSMIEHVKANFKGKSVAYSPSTLNSLGHSFCVYRGSAGAKCAIGMFIPDSEYKPEWEKQHVLYLCQNYGIKRFMPLEDLEGLALLQRAHDRSRQDDTLNTILTWIEKNVEST